MFRNKNYRPHVDLPQRVVRPYINAGLDYVITNSQGDLWIDLVTLPAPKHFALAIEPELLWESAQSVLIDGVPVPVPCPEHMLFLLCVHASKHYWQALLWICDIAVLLQKHQGLDFEKLMAAAERQGGRRVLMVGLQLARILMKVKLPDRIEEQIEKDLEAQRLVDDIAGRGLQAEETAHAGIDTFLFHMRMRERVTDRMRHAILLALTPSYSDWMSLPLPEPLFFLYWLTRPFRLLFGRRRKSALQPG
jgi:hypothetical protein